MTSSTKIVHIPFTIFIKVDNPARVRSVIDQRFSSLVWRMSAFIAEPARSDDIAEEARSGIGVSGRGQRHDRISLEDDSTAITGAKDVGGRDSDVSATQKMISATWGSILTSILGTCCSLSAAF